MFGYSSIHTGWAKLLKVKGVVLECYRGLWIQKHMSNSCAPVLFRPPPLLESHLLVATILFLLSTDSSRLDWWWRLWGNLLKYLEWNMLCNDVTRKTCVILNSIYDFPFWLFHFENANDVINSGKRQQGVARSTLQSRCFGWQDAINLTAWLTSYNI